MSEFDELYLAALQAAMGIRDCEVPAEVRLEALTTLKMEIDDMSGQIRELEKEIR